MDSLFQVLHGIPSVGVAHRRLPFLVLRRELAGDWVEGVVEERVRDRHLRPVGLRDRNVIQSNDLVWRGRLACPVPVRSTQVGSGLLPGLSVVGISLSDLLRMLLD